VKYDPARHHRRSIRLKGYDYTQAGAYFITICTHGRECLFGEVVDGEMRLNTLGEIVHRTWSDLPNHVVRIVLDEFVVMPNHIHGIIMVGDQSVVGAGSVGAGSVGAGSEPAPTTTKRHGLPEIIRQFKTFSARRINEHRGTAGTPVWQRNYYEHIIRDEESLNRIREYIANNPLQWELDRENPDVQQRQPHRVAPTGDEPWRV
jgi:putative transposase